MSATLAAMLGVSGVASAKDALKVAVEPAAAFTFDQFGNPLSSGTYAIGTIKIYMVVVGTTWPATLPSVTLDLSVEQRMAKPPTQYPVLIRLRDVGAGLELTPVQAEFTVGNAAWLDTSTVGVTVPQKIIDDPTMNADGTVLVGNLQTETTATKSGFDTVTTVKIHAMLVHPSVSACLKTATFVTNPALSMNLSHSTSDTTSGLDFTYKWKKNNSGGYDFEYTVSPPETRDNVIVVNTCATAQDYDVGIELAPKFQKKGNGNIVTSYVSANANATDFPLNDPYAELKAAKDSSDFPTGTEASKGLCVQTNSLAAQYSQWLSASVEIPATGAFADESEIPGPNLATPSYTGFKSVLYKWTDKTITPTPPPGCQDFHSLRPTDGSGDGTADVYVKSKTCNASGGNQACSKP